MTVPQHLAAALADRYRLERELGQGGMATVYLAADVKHRRRVAVKVLRPELAAALGADRFLREIETTANLRHPHILPLYDSGEVGGFLFYVMPLIEGESLRDRLRREQRLPIEDARTITREVADALQYAHDRGVIHRDIKPENILLEGGHAIVADFGIAKAASAVEGGLTQTGMAIGTPAYMSPEQALADRSLDARSDLYSLGCVLFEMLTGAPPFVDSTPQRSIARRLTEPPPAATASRPEVGVHLSGVVQQALATDPGQRPASAARFSELLLAAAPAHPPAPATVATPPARRRGVAAAVLAVLLIGAAVVGLFLRRRPATATLDSIVVLPFENRSNDAEADYISDGITESISNSLTRLPGLKVIPTSVAYHYKGKAMDPRKVADELGVSAVLTGRISQHGDEVAVGVELDDVRQGKQIWGERYDRKVADLLAVQSDIATEVSQRLRSELAGTERQALTRGSTDNAAAYQLYLKGNHYASTFTKDGFRRGIDYFNQAIALDSNYALAYAGLAFTWINGEDWFWAPNEGAPKAREAARRALAIDETLPSAHLALAIVSHWYDWDWVTAEREFRRAIELNPGDPRPHGFYTWLLAPLGRSDEAIAEGRRAQELDPVSPEAAFMLGSTLYYLRRYDEAIVQLRGVVDLDAGYWFAYDFLGRSYEQTHRPAEAMAAYQKAYDLERENSENVSHLGYAYAVAGRRAEAKRVLADLQDTSKWGYVAPYNIALVHLGLGDDDAAFAALERAFTERSSMLAFYLDTDARWDRLHGDPRFVDLLRRVGLPALHSP